MYDTPKNRTDTDVLCTTLKTRNTMKKKTLDYVPPPRLSQREQLLYGRHVGEVVTLLGVGIAVPRLERETIVVNVLATTEASMPPGPCPPPPYPLLYPRTDGLGKSSTGAVVARASGFAGGGTIDKPVGTVAAAAAAALVLAAAAAADAAVVGGEVASNGPLAGASAGGALPPPPPPWSRLSSTSAWNIGNMISTQNGKVTGLNGCQILHHRAA